MMTTAEKIEAYAAELAEGETLSAKELLHLGERASIDQALSRLVKRGALLRVGRGMYARPVTSRFGTRAPSPEAVLHHLAMKTGETIAPSGAAGANMLGLTPQNPIKPVYLTSGQTRALTLGGQTVELRHAASWQLREPETKPGHAMRALAWFGEAHAAEAIGQLRATLAPEELSELYALRGTVPGWMAKELSALVA